jgi:L-iditol 2-dehydrogenase
VGEIEKTGEKVTSFHKGQRFGLIPNAGCGTCDNCISGKSNYCAQYTAFGIDRDGGHAPFVKITSQFIGNMVPLPDTISDLEGSLLEPLSCVINGIRVSKIELGDTVVVFGTGPIGRMHIMLSKISGAAKVIAVDIAAKSLEKAVALGADVAIDSSRESVPARIMQETGNRGANVVITACPVAAVQEQAVGLLAPFGRLCLFGGLAAGSKGIQFDSNAVHYKNLVVTGCTGGSPEDYRIGIRLVENKKIDLNKIISDTFGMNELEAAYKKAQSNPEGKVTIINNV